MGSEFRILVVDDHPVNRLVLAALFGELGCEVVTAEDGDQALAAMAAETFDLVCLDRHMPGLSGDEVAARMPPSQFVLAWSTDVTDLPARFNGTLAKPVDAAAARSALTRAMTWRAGVGPGAGPAPQRLPRG